MLTATSEEQLRRVLREVPQDVWVHAMERLFTDRLAAGGYDKFTPSLRLRLLCAWKDMKDSASELTS